MAQNEALFSGKSQAKGRNGYFTLARVAFYDFSKIDQQYPIMLEFWSKRTGDAPPIRFQLTQNDARQLQAFINESLAESHTD